MWLAQGVLAMVLVATTPGPGEAMSCEEFSSLRQRSAHVWRLLPVRENAAWAYTKEGLARWDGCRWTNEGLPETRSLGGELVFWAAGSSDLWVAASYGTTSDVPTEARQRLREPSPMVESVLYRWARGRWHELARIPPSQRRVRALWGAGPNDVRLVLHDTGPLRTGHSRVLRWDGRRLKPLAISLKGAALPDEVDLAGGRSSRFSWLASAHDVLIWNGRSWRLTRLPNDFYVWDVAGPNASDLWAVGAGDSSPAFHFNGELWTPQSTPKSFTTVAVRSDGRVVAADWNGATYLREGTGWRLLLEPVVSERWRLEAPWANCLWSDEGHDEALGLHRNARDDATLVGPRTWLGWSRWALRAATEDTATSVWESPAGDAWATTAARWNDQASPLGALLHRSDGGWQRVFETKAPMIVVAGYGGRVWAGGAGGTLVTCDGGHCVYTPSGTSDDIVALWEMSGQLWAGGSRGALLTWDDAGKRWRSRQTGSSQRAMRAVAGFSLTRIYAADARGLFRWTGRDWSEVNGVCPQGTSSSSFSAVGARGPSELWASGGCSGTSPPPPRFGNIDSEWSAEPWGLNEVWREDGVAWLGVASFGACSLTVAQDAVWIAGPEGKVSRWSGTLSSFDTGVRRRIRQVVPNKNGRLWIVTSNDSTPLLIDAVANTSP